MSSWKSRPRRWLLVAVPLALLAAALAAFTAFGLSGSTFESADGNLVVNTSGNHDWNSPVEAISCPATIPGAGTNCGTDLIKSGTDNAFGQGAKEDTPNPSEVTGSIPPNKSDLMRFYVNKEKASGKDFLYLAWERSNVLGTANMDFEFNQRSDTPTGKNTPFRTDGDMLVTFDFENGGAKPVLGLLKWLTAAGGAAASDCFSSNALPCWGVRQTDDLKDGVDDQRLDLSDAGFADGQINQSSVQDANTPLVAIPGQTAGTLPGSTFGEAGINLTDSGVFSQTACTHFGSAFLKSRSSTSFTAELKDFIAPVPVNIANCGGLTVKKYIDSNENGSSDSGDATALTGDLDGWSFTVTGGPGNISCTGTTTNGVLSVSGAGCDLTTLLAGTYTVKENANASKTIGSNASPFFNTDPGDGSGGIAAAPVTKQVSINVGDSKTVVFGNSCYARGSFSVTGVPSSVNSVSVAYSVNGQAKPDIQLSLKPNTTDTYIGSTPSTLRKGDSISWSWYINGDSANSVSVLSAITLAGYPSCGGSGTDKFAPSTVTGSKYKDINGNGSQDQGVEPGLQGFKFQLIDSSNTVKDTATSDANGTYKFSNVLPGSYTVHELVPTGWKQTQPASGDRSVTVALNQSAQVDPFGDTPLSKIDVKFTSEATVQGGADAGKDATHATSITCKDASNASVGSDTDNDLTTSDLQLKQSKVVCEITYVDP